MQEDVDDTKEGSHTCSHINGGRQLLEFLVNIPGKPPALSEEEYSNVVTGFREELNRAIELFEAYWRTGNATLFDMSLEKLLQAHLYMIALTDEITDERLLEKLRNRATFIYDLAACVLGAKNV